MRRRSAHAQTDRAIKDRERGIRENVFSIIHQLSEQKVLKLNNKQKKIVRTMMLAQTQLLAERKLLKSSRN